MPLHAFTCSRCDHFWEKYMPRHSDPNPPCPACNSARGWVPVVDQNGSSPLLLASYTAESRPCWSFEENDAKDAQTDTSEYCLSSVDEVVGPWIRCGNSLSADRRTQILKNTARLCDIGDGPISDVPTGSGTKLPYLSLRGHCSDTWMWSIPDGPADPLAVLIGAIDEELMFARFSRSTNSIVVQHRLGMILWDEADRNIDITQYRRAMDFSDPVASLRRMAAQSFGSSEVAHSPNGECLFSMDGKSIVFDQKICAKYIEPIQRLIGNPHQRWRPSDGNGGWERNGYGCLQRTVNGK